MSPSHQLARDSYTRVRAVHGSIANVDHPYAAAFSDSDTSSTSRESCAHVSAIRNTRRFFKQPSERIPSDT